MVVGTRGKRVEGRAGLYKRIATQKYRNHLAITRVLPDVGVLKVDALPRRRARFDPEDAR